MEPRASKLLDNNLFLLNAWIRNRSVTLAVAERFAASRKMKRFRYSQGLTRGNKLKIMAYCKLLIVGRAGLHIHKTQIFL